MALGLPISNSAIISMLTGSKSGRRPREFATHCSEIWPASEAKKSMTSLKM